LNVSDIWETEIHTAEPLVPDPSPSEDEIVIAKLKRYQVPGSDEIPAEPIQAAGGTSRSDIYKLFILFGVRKNRLIGGRSLLLHQFTRWVIKLTVVIIVGYHCYQLHTKYYSLKVKSIHR
jgi:hypothetical protein